MKMMDISMDDDDCTVEAVMSVKKKKLTQAQLPFQTSSSVKSSSNSTNIVPKKNKRKVTSPLVESRGPKVSKLSKKTCLDENILEGEGENAKEKDDSLECIVTTKNEKRNSEQSDRQNENENEKGNVTSKRSSLGKKSKKLDKSQPKLGALTKFLRKTDSRDIASNDSDTSCESKARQDTFVSEEKDEVCSDESMELQSLDKANSQVSQANEKLEDLSIRDKETKSPFLQQSDSDIAILSSDNEDSSEWDKSMSSRNEESKKPATPTTPKTDKSAKKKLKKLTPKQLEKRREIARKREEKLKLKMEKEKKREEEKASRQREREQRQKEREEKERMEKEQKKKEKELKDLKKQMEIEQKQKDKEAKEEERRKREEEKRRKEEEKLEAERRKQKAASNFASFFVSKKIKQTEEESEGVEAKNFMPFEVKADMRIAPVCRRILNENEKTLFDEKRDTNVRRSELYLEDIKNGGVVPRTSSKTWPLEAKDDDIVLLDDNDDDDNDGSSNIIRETHNLEKHRPKLLQFKENRRPPYWGTWRKRSKILNPRRPFMKDKKWFDYEVDSDDEWEEEEPGESLKGSDDEKDEENPEDNEYDVDNEFMVPHGYLSDEEAQADEEEDMSPQTQKMKLKILGEQFEAERNAKTHKLKPKIIGCIWEGAGNSLPECISSHVAEILSARRAWVRCIPIKLPSSATTEDDSANAESRTSATSTRGPKKTKFPNEALPDLIRLLHGNTHGRRFLMREFMTFWNKKDGGQLSKVSVLQTINDVAKRMACPEKGPLHLRSCWYVSEDMRKEHLPDDEELSLPNRWTYILTPSRKSKDTQDVADKPEKEEREKEKPERKHVPLITQFAKKITQEEMKRQLARPEADEEASKQPALPKLFSQAQQPVTSKLPALQRPPKRATLISIGRGEQFPEKSRMLARFVGNKKPEEEALTSNEKMMVDNVDDDDVVFLESVDANRVASQKPEASGEKAVAADCDDDPQPSKGGSIGANVMFVDDVS